MFPIRLLGLPETFESTASVINDGHLVLEGLPLSAQPAATCIDNGRGSTMGILLEVSLFYGEREFGVVQLPIRVQESDTYVLPAVIDWSEEGEPYVVEAVEDLLLTIEEHWANLRNWCSPWYVRHFPAANVAARISDQMTRRLNTYIRETAIQHHTSQAASSLVRIVPMPAKFLGNTAGMTAPEQQLACLVEGARRVKAKWPNDIDITAGSQDRPLEVASLAINGISPLISGTPFNSHYVPDKRSFIIRSCRGMRAVRPTTPRVSVQGYAAPFENCTVNLWTAFCTLPFGSLDAQVLHRRATDKLTSLAIQRMRLTNPRHLSVEEGDIVIDGQLLAYDHEGKERFIKLPSRAVPPGKELPKNSRPGRAVISSIYSGMDYGDGAAAEQIIIEYQYLHPVGSGDKIATPHGLKGVVVEVDFEIEAFINGAWREVEVASSETNLHKRGSAAFLHGALEAMCELEDETMEVPVDAKWEDVLSYASPKVAARIEAKDKLSTGRVPVHYRRKEADGSWGPWINLGYTWVGLVPWMRTTNTAFNAVKVGRDAVPQQLITQVSCLRGNRSTFDKPLMDWYVPSKPVVAQQLCDVLSLPCITEKQAARLNPGENEVTLIRDDLSVVYRGKTYHPTVVDRAFETVGDLSMQVLHPHEHRKPIEGSTLEKKYPRTLLDTEISNGMLLAIPKGWTPPAATRRYSLVQCSWLFLPPRFCSTLLRVNTSEPTTLHPIINRTTLYLNALLEIQAPGADPNGTRQAPVRKLVTDVLTAEVTERGGAFYTAFNPRKPGIQYVNLALDCCPAGVLWMSERMMKRYNAEIAKDANNPHMEKLQPLRYGDRGITERFPITAGRGLQGVIIQPMPSWINADVVTNSTTSEVDQDGDNDGDLGAVTFPPSDYAREVDLMRRSYPLPKPSVTESVPIKEFISTIDGQIHEATLMAELKRKIGPASSVIYWVLAAMKWTPEREAHIPGVLAVMEALLRSAVKKHILDSSVWGMMALLRSVDPALEARVKAGLLSVMPEERQEEVSNGFDYLLHFLDSIPQNTQLAYSATLGSSRLSANTNAKFLGFLSQVGTDGLLKQLREELVEGAI